MSYDHVLIDPRQMLRSASLYRLLAATLALVMLVGITLPAVAHACEAMQRVATMSCCSAADDEPAMPCHESQPADEANHAAATCCSSSVLVATSEAALTEASVVPPVVMTWLAATLWPASERESHLSGFPDDARTSPASTLGFYVLYGALLN